MNEQRLAQLQAQYDRFVSAGLKLDLTRGKPSPEQLDLSNEMDGILDGFYLLQDGTDVRNYGGILGIPEARELGAAVLEVTPNQVLVGGNSSLTLMFNYCGHKLKHWRQSESDTVKFLCPVPGYDRHFTVCEHLNIEMIAVPVLDSGPDMDLVEQLVRDDESIKGIWCVPKYSNPTGCTYSSETVERLAKLPRFAGSDFVVFWDNAYIVHELTDTPTALANILQLAEKQDTADNIAVFASTSKITFAGAGISFLATTADQLSLFEKHLSAQLIGFDKVNQLRHVRFLQDVDGLKAHMSKHQNLLKPKFELVLNKLNSELGGKEIAQWTDPKGGYFVSLDTKPGLASEIIALAAAAGVKLTPAGATFPYGNDPDDTNIRIAPTFPSISELEQAMDVFVTCVELATLNAAQS